jgi:hypothetical protein
MQAQIAFSAVALAATLATASIAQGGRVPLFEPDAHVGASSQGQGQVQGRQSTTASH